MIAKKHTGLFSLLCLALCLALLCAACSDRASQKARERIVSCASLIGQPEEALVQELGEGERTLISGTEETLFREYEFDLFGNPLTFMATIDLGTVLDFSADLSGTFEEWTETITDSLGDPDESDDEQAVWSVSEEGGLLLTNTEDSLTLSFFRSEA